MNMNMNMDKKGKMSMVGENSDKKESNEIYDTFPAGLRVLVVENDPAYLEEIEKLLKQCSYEVTMCSSAVHALSLLQERNYEFDIVISEVHMPCMDGFMLLEKIHQEKDLPFIMMSFDESKDVVMKSVRGGACDYLIKPIRIERLTTIWQHVVRKRENEKKELENLRNDRLQKSSDVADYASSENEYSWKNRKQRNQGGVEERDDSSMPKKPRVLWTVELNRLFIESVNQLGIEKAVPKKILELMNVPGLTRENVASHLQKHRLNLKKNSGVSQQQNGLNRHICQPNVNLESILVPDEVDIQAHEFPPQPEEIGRSTMVDQMNIVGPETSNLNFEVEQQQLRNNNKHELRTSNSQLAHLHEHTPSFGNMCLQVPEVASRFLNFTTRTRLNIKCGNHCNSQMFNKMTHSQSQSQHGFLNSLGHQIFSNEIVGQVLERDETILDGRCATYNPALQASGFDFSMNRVRELPGNGSPHGNTAGIFTSTRTFQDGNDGNINFSPNHSIFNDVQQNISQDACLSFKVSQNANVMQGYLNPSSSILGNEGILYNQRTRQNILGKAAITRREENVQQFRNILLADNSLRIKKESMHDLTGENTLLDQHSDQDYLASELLKQPGAIDNNFITLMGFNSTNKIYTP